MKFRMLLVAAAMLMFAATSFGQGWMLTVWEEETPLTTVCGGTVPIPMGEGAIALYMDVDSDGPDETDPLAPAGGGTGTLNINVRPFNWDGGEAGMFYVDPQWVAQGAPLPVNRVYVRVLWPTLEHPTVVYTSTEVWNITAATNDFEGDWNCVDVGPGPCTQTASVNLVPTGIGPQTGVNACFNMCANGAPIPVCVGPVVRDNRIPLVHFASTGCDNCVFIPVTLGGPWVWTVIEGQGYFCNTLIQPAGASLEGCGNIVLDAILPVELTSFTATPADGEVVVAWTTRSENGLSAFEVIRDGVKVAELAANNVATESTYKFVDADAENGTRYSYELVVVNADGSRESLETVSATPSWDAAVITEYALHQNFPNPFNPTTSITFDLVDANDVTITVYNAMGQQVASMMNGQNVKAGRHTLSFDATNLTSGLYFYTIKAGNDFTATKKMLLVK